MSSTSVRLFNWELEHPIILASGPFSNDEKSINNAFANGAAAVVTKTITAKNSNSSGCTRYRDLVFNRDGYSVKSLEQWASILETLRGRKVIASIFADTPEDLADLACFVVSHGVEVIELGLSCPTFGSDPVCFVSEQLRAFCSAVRKAVNVPILVKILIATSREKNREMASCIKESGIEGISLSDTLPAIILNPKNGSMQLGGAGGLSGPLLKPLVLKALYDISDIGLEIVGIGGIETAQDIMDYVQLGAGAVQVCSLIFKRKLGAISELSKELSEELSSRGVCLKDLSSRTIREQEGKSECNKI